MPWNNSRMHTPFQSLNRAYKRSDLLYIDAPMLSLDGFNPSIGLTSVPTISLVPDPAKLLVSIPQSGLQAFRLVTSSCITHARSCFNPSIGLTSVPTRPLNPLFRDIAGRFNPSIGLTSVPTCFADVVGFVPDVFQSLNRAYKRSDDIRQTNVLNVEQGFNPSIGLTSVPTAYIPCSRYRMLTVSIPQSGLQAFRRRSKRRSTKDFRSFNPSIGLTSVPTWTHFLTKVDEEVFQSLNRAYKRSDHSFLLSMACL